ncbi:tyrosine-type recombinase/integrase [Acinetobacter sp. ANC 3832]|uniref:tyrosine-type recombinase/integrase n=1 Tax=Acinetobacter sp. ANC 3832 TaxID=1977874 RepID=UPI000A33ED6B|nr:site-specific integrase [Acinetobacter sp. ANC 3832]OTG94646.1 integrase [Acinetobacter sp. ANC 3832]
MKLPKARKRGEAFRIELMFNGKRISATRDTEKECEQWAMLKLLELKTEKSESKGDVKPHFPLSVLMHKYYEEIGKHKKSSRTIKVSINHFIKNFLDIAEMSVHDITPQILTEWRNLRLKDVSTGTVLRDVSLFSAIFTYAQKELFLIDNNPFSLISKPPQPKSRNRRINEFEIDLILQAHDYARGQIPTCDQHFIAWAFLFAIETTMRQGEILNIERSNIFDDYIHLAETKNGDYRDVPLLQSAKDLLKLIKPNGTNKLIDMKNSTFQNMFGNRIKKLGINDLHFHDTRHEGITRLVKLRKVPIEILMKITGHKTAGILINTYYNPTASEISSMLNESN